MNTLPRKKIHENEAARSMAYQNRLREEKAALKALALAVAENAGNPNVTMQQLLEELPQKQRELVQRSLDRSQNSAKNLSKVAA